MLFEEKNEKKNEVILDSHVAATTRDWAFQPDIFNMNLVRFPFLFFPSLFPSLAHAGHLERSFSESFWGLGTATEMIWDNWAGTQHFLQDCMCAQRRLRSVCRPSEDSDQTAHSRSLIRVFAGHSVGSQGSKVSSGEQQRIWSDYANVRADLSLCLVHLHFCRLCCAPTRIYALKDWSLEVTISCTANYKIARLIVKPVMQSHDCMFVCFCFFFFVLRFYGPVNPMGSCRARSVYHTFTGQA